MTKFNETNAGLAFIGSGDSRETSREIMEALAFHARNEAEAEALWSGAGIGRYATLLDIWETATKNGLHDAEGFCWGAAGTKWFAQMSET